MSYRPKANLMQINKVWSLAWIKERLLARWWSYNRRADRLHELFWELNNLRQIAAQRGESMAIYLTAHDAYLLQRRLRRYKITQDGPLLRNRVPIAPHTDLPVRNFHC